MAGKRVTGKARTARTGEDAWPGTVQLDVPLVAGRLYATWMYCQLFADDAGAGAVSLSNALEDASF